MRNHLTLFLHCCFNCFQFVGAVVGNRADSGIVGVMGVFACFSNDRSLASFYILGLIVTGLADIIRLANIDDDFDIGVLTTLLLLKIFATPLTATLRRRVRCFLPIVPSLALPTAKTHCVPFFFPICSCTTLASLFHLTLMLMLPMAPLKPLLTLTQSLSVVLLPVPLLVQLLLAQLQLDPTVQLTCFLPSHHSHLLTNLSTKKYSKKDTSYSCKLDNKLPRRQEAHNMHFGILF